MRVMVMVKATKKSEAGITPGDPGFVKLLEVRVSASGQEWTRS